MDSSPRQNPPFTRPASRLKRPASLLPAFEPLGSSPSLPRPQKRVARDSQGDMTTYPTPVPTSSTHILSSSPRNPLPRPKLQRNSFTTERVPLSTVPTVMLPDSGEPILMGRSSASCHHQLSAHKSISRVHVKATYKPADNPFDLDRVEISCVGWNGIQLHCQGKTYDLDKDSTFTSDIKDADILIDVQDSRVLVQWPRLERKDSGSFDSDQTWDEISPRRGVPSRSVIQDSPLRDRPLLASPISPSPAVRALLSPPSPLLATCIHNPVVVYEDEPSPSTEQATTNPLSTSQTTETAPESADGAQSSQSSELSDLSKYIEDFSDHDEENDPIIHSFGPYGENILPRMASFRAGQSPIRPSRSSRNQPEPLRPADSPPQRSVPKTRRDGREALKKVPDLGSSIENHVINQLAFSRLSSTPFSTILNNLPTDLWNKECSTEEGLSKHEIENILESAKCIGEVNREGKDAAGKPLENEYYYLPDLDDDDMRREAVVNDLRKPGLRSCRRQHKVRQFFQFIACSLLTRYPSNISGANQNEQTRL